MKSSVPAFLDSLLYGPAVHDIDRQYIKYS